MGKTSTLKFLSAITHCSLYSFSYILFATYLHPQPVQTKITLKLSMIDSG